MSSMETKINWAYFGSSEFSVEVLDELERLNFLPNLIVTTPDKPKGRGLKLVSGPVKSWAEQRGINVLSPEKLNKEFAEELSRLGAWDFFLVASYGKIIPESVFSLPQKGSLNIHPSLLPKFRGPTPLESAILSADQTGVSIMLVDKEVDHGPVIDQKIVDMSWPPYYVDLRKTLAVEGAKLFYEVVDNWLNDKIEAKDQDHSQATFTKKFSSEDLKISLEDSSEKNLRKIRAFAKNRNSYFFAQNGEKTIRVAVTEAGLIDGKLVIEKVKPESKNEMSYEDFKRGLRT